MKKTIAFILLCLVGAIFTTGCENSKLSRKEYTLATGSRSGVYYPIGETLAQILKEEFPDVTLKVIETGGSVENLQLIKDKKVDLALVQNDIAHYAVNGEAMFNGEKITNISGIATLFPEIIQFVVRKDTGINMIEDLSGHKIAVGSKDSGTFYNAQQILSTAGVWNNISHQYMNAAEAMQELHTGNIDGFIFTSGLPNPSIIELGKKIEIKLLPISSELTQKLINSYSFYYPSLVGMYQYPGQSEEFQALEINAIVVSSENLNENDQYLITKHLFGKPNELGKNHPRLSKMTKASLRHQLSVKLGSGAFKAHSEIK